MSNPDQLIRLLRGGVRGEAKRYFSGLPGLDALSLPPDYVRTISELGSGFSFDDKLSILHPKVIRRDSGQHQRDLEAIHGSEGVCFYDGRLVSSVDSPLGREYVRFSSLVCWGMDNSGKKLFWDTSEETGQWHVIATDCSVSWARHKMSFGDYLYKLITRDLICPVFTKPAWPRGGVGEVHIHEIDF
ncbi:hypothetical protein [Nocardiopsis valliformis]|uniref:hypothetical protein n=1 Tax=Nocardiopsis valliformis TaxID=239974 RepID=UPI0012678679|nr:hypothetical protein [Nocardiopsis valliformis]